MKKIGVAIIGPGNIGSDLMFKVFRSRNLEMKLMTGRKLSAGIQRASQLGIETTIDGVDGLLARKDELGIQIVFDATSASAHLANAPKLKEAGLTWYKQTDFLNDELLFQTTYELEVIING